MLRTTIGLSFVLALASAIACSSKSTDDNNTGGNGAIVGGSGGNAGNTSGGTTGLCADDSPVCVDAMRVSGCNPDTGKVETFSCVDEYAALGIVSKGCTSDATGDGCTVDDLTDQACADGTSAVAYCENATDEEAFNAYTNCFQDVMGLRAVITCFSKYVTPTMKTSADCVAAEDACLGAGTGGTGAGGTGSGGTGGSAGSAAQAGGQGGDPAM